MNSSKYAAFSVDFSAFQYGVYIKIVQPITYL